MHLKRPNKLIINKNFSDVFGKVKNSPRGDIKFNEKEKFSIYYLY
jgi:hypothetical protein